MNISLLVDTFDQAAETPAATRSSLVASATRHPEHTDELSGVPTTGAIKSTGATAKKRRRRPRYSAQQLRDKQQREVDDSRILNLTLDVNDLRQQVHNCLVRRSVYETRLLLARERFHARALQSVANFFLLLRDGHRDVRPAHEQHFLEALLDRDIRVGGAVTGRAQFFEQWRRYKHFFHVCRLRHFSAQLVTSDADSCVIDCTGEFQGHVSLTTLEAVFPHILEDNTLVRRVLGHEFVCPTHTRIHLDAGGRFVQYDAYSDVFMALTALLAANPIDAVTLMANAIINEGSMLPSACVHEVSDEEGYVDEQVTDERGAEQCTQAQASAPSRASIDFILS